MAHTRPPPQFPGSFRDLDVLPELAGKSLVELAKRGMAVKVWCRACGRDVILPPTPLMEIARAHSLLMTIEQLARVSRCVTCGAHEAQFTGWPLASDGPPVVRSPGRAPQG